MTTTEVAAMIAELQQFNADFTHIEAKEAKNDLPKHAWQTVSAFSNSHNGGTMLFGVAERQKFQPLGVQNSAKIQHDFACLCSGEMEPPVRPIIQIHNIRGKHIVSASIPEITNEQKPCYHKQAGYTNGAYIRVADGNRQLTTYEVQMMLSARTQPLDDQEAVTEATIADLQPRLLKGLLARVRKRPGTPLARESDMNALKKLRVLTPFRNRLVCTVGGLLALGKYPQQFFPALGINFVVYPERASAIPEPTRRDFSITSVLKGPSPTC